MIFLVVFSFVASKYIFKLVNDRLLLQTIYRPIIFKFEILNRFEEGRGNFKVTFYMGEARYLEPE